MIDFRRRHKLNLSGVTDPDKWGGCVSIKAVPNQTCGSICRDNPSGIKGTVESTSYIYLSPQKSDIIGRIQ